MSTLLLDRSTWDLLVDANGNIAVAEDPYAIAQDVASALRLFKGELWYDTTDGVPYWEKILGKPPSVGVIKAAWIQAALSVPGVATAQAFITGFSNRKLSGQVQVTTTQGQTLLITATSSAADFSPVDFGGEFAGGSA
jgi:hypothetical protein